MILTELKELNQANGGHFFDRATMKHFGDTMRGFSFKSNGDGTGTVTRKRFGTTWRFNLGTGLVIHSQTPTMLQLSLHR